MRSNSAMGMSLARRLRQSSDADEMIGQHLHLLVDHIVDLFVQPLDDLGRLFRMHHLVGPGRDQMHVVMQMIHVGPMAEAPAGTALIQGLHHFFSEILTPLRPWLPRDAKSPAL